MKIIDDKILDLIRKEVEGSYNKIINISEIAAKFCIDKKEMHYRFILKFGKSIMELNKEKKIEYLNKLIDQDDESKPQTSYIFALKLGYKSDPGLQCFIRKNKGMTFKEYYNFRTQNKR